MTGRGGVAGLVKTKITCPNRGRFIRRKVQAVKFAREQANDSEAPEKTIGATLSGDLSKI